MSYDRDVYWTRIVAECLAATHFGIGTLNLLAHNWLVAIACFAWMFSMLLTVRSQTTQQITRDQCRLTQAGLTATRNEIETGEY